MKGKVVATGISLILVVGVIIGIVATVSRGNSNSSSPSEPGIGGIPTGMKAVETLCAPSKFKDACINTLTPVAKKDGSVDVRELMQASFKATRDEVKNALNKTGSLGIQHNNTYDKMTLDSCYRYFDTSVRSVEYAIIKTSDSQMQTLGDLTGVLNIYVGAVCSYYTTCLDNIENPELKKAMEDVVKNMSEKAINSLYIINGVRRLFDAVNITVPLNLNEKGSRQLGEHIEIDEHGYPTWLSEADRRILKGRHRQVPNAVVAQDGSGQFDTIQAAINAYPQNHKGRYIVYVKAGTYTENVIVPATAINVHIYGDNPRKTIVTGERGVATKVFVMPDTATFSVLGHGFTAKSITFRNTAGPLGNQALALRTEADMAAFFNCRFEGYQDTLFYQSYRSFYRDCTIMGTVDFIFGMGSAIIQDSSIIVRLPLPGQTNMVTADGRPNDQMIAGLSIQNCRISADKRLKRHQREVKTYLGRPWKPQCRVMIMQSDLGDLIDPEGWNIWKGNEDTAEVMEFANRGPGANTAGRVRWKHSQVVTDPRVAERFTAGRFYPTGSGWLDATGFPHNMGL